MSKPMNWDRAREQRRRNSYRVVVDRARARPRASSPSCTRVAENEDGSRIVQVTSRRGKIMDSWKAAPAASPCRSLDPESPEFAEIVRRYS